MTVIRSIVLHCTTGGSDKIYALDLVQAADGTHTVNYGNGRRGLTLATGTKLAGADLAKATKVYEKTMSEKVGNGYRPIGGTDHEEGTAAPALATMDARATDFAPQLANFVDETGIAALLADPAWVAQEKFDGERRGVIRPVGTAYGANRKGLSVALPEPLAATIERVAPDTILDAEHVGDTLYIFDILRLAGQDTTSLPLRQRLESLASLSPIFHDCPNVIIAETATTTPAKLALLERVKAGAGEGMVFKRADVPYAAGRPNSGGDWLKHKLYKTLSAIVARQNDQRSVALELLEPDGTRITVGNVTIPANQPIPAIGAVVEIRYLYAYPEGALYQPVYLGERQDIAPAECLATQREFKAEASLSQAA